MNTGTFRLKGVAFAVMLGLGVATDRAAAETLCAEGSGAIRADLRTGTVRVTDSTEALPYSTEWDGGETATIADNDETAFQGSDSGTYRWTPTTGLHELTHTVVTGGVKVVLKATFRMGETLIAAGSGEIRADLCTGEVRTAYPTEMLTYSTEWDGGETATIADNGSVKFQDSGSGLYGWTPQYAGTHLLTHTVVTGGVSVVETAVFEVNASQNVPVAWQIGATDDDLVVAWTNATGTLVIEGAGKMMSFASDGTDVPWPQEDVAAVTVDPAVTQIGTNAWYGLGANVGYTVYAPAAKTLNVGFGGVSPQLGYARTSFKAVQASDGVVSLAVALETTPSLTNEWTEVTLEKDDVSVDDNGRIVIEHQTGDHQQGFYTIQATEN